MSYNNKRRYRRGRQNNNKRSRNNSKSQYIDPSRFVRVATPATREEYKPTNTFSDFKLSSLIANNLAKKGYASPSPIQDQTIPLTLQGKDIIGIAETGTGKTGAFAIPILNRLIADKSAHAIIIAPTRELAQQIFSECKSIALGSDINAATLIGGTGMGQQLRDLKANPQIVIGTPGRIKDHLERGTLKLNRFNVVVLDEVDRMLDMGFVHDIKNILSRVSEHRQSLFFSATMDSRVSQLITTFSKDPITIKLKVNQSSENVHQDVVHSYSNNKLDTLHDLLQDSNTVRKVILFDETQRRVEKLKKDLSVRGFDVDAIHGGKTQGQRTRALKKFKNNEISILVATDVAARGIDVPDVSHVINYSIPKTYEDYVHRIGRTGRAGQVGYALTFIEKR